MSSIDERIVELQFNNGQFEQGVATSLGTLEKLKKGLNLEASANSLKGLNAAGKSFSLANVATNIQTVADRFSALGIIGDQVLRRITDGAIRFGKSLITAVPNQIIQGGKRRAQNIKHAQFMLEGLLKDNFDWDKISEDISFAVNETAYGFDEAAKVASQLAASNIEFGDDMKHALRAVSGVAAMTGDSYENIGRIFAQVAGQGRLMGDQLLQISQRGLNAAAILGESLGKSEAEVRDMTSKGQISFKQFAEAMYNAFGEQATKAEETFDGALSNVKASLSRMGAQFATPAYEEVRKVLLALKEVFKTIEKLIVPISDAFTVAAQTASKNAISFLGDVNTFLKGFLDADGKVKGFGKKAKESFSSYSDIQEIMQNLSKAGPTVQKNLDKTVEAIFGIAEQSKLSYKDVGSVFQEVAEKGVLTSSALGALESRGVKATEALSKSLGKTESQVRVMTAKGMISFQSFADAMDKAFGVNATGTITLEQQAVRMKRLMDVVHGGLKDTKLYGEMTKGMGKVADFLGLNLELNASLKDGVTDSEELVTVANKVINGLYGNGEERKKLLTEEYGGWELIQNKVNELLGCEVRHETNQKEINKNAKENNKEAEKGNEEAKKQNEKLKTSQAILSGLFATVQGFISALNILKNAGSALWNNLISPFVQWAVPKIVAGILSITGLIGDKLVKLETKLTQSDFFNKKTKELATFFTTTKDKIVEFGKKVGSLPGVERLGKAMQNLIAFAKELGSKAAKAISGFFSQFSGKELGIGNGILSFIDSVSNKISGFIDMITGKKTKIDFKKSLFGTAEKAINKFNTGLDSLTGKKTVLDKFLGFFKGFGKFKMPKLPKLDFKSMFGNLSSAKNKIAKLFKSILPNTKGLTNFFKDFNLDKIIKVVTAGGFAVASIKLAKFFKSLSDGASSVANIPTKFVKTLNLINSSMKATQLNLHSETILNIAEAIGILALAVVGLSMIPADNLANATVNIAILMGMFALLLVAVSKITAKSDAIQQLDPLTKILNDFLTGMKTAFAKAAKLVGMATLILSIAAAIGIVVKTLVDLATGDAIGSGKLEYAALVLTGVMAAIGAAAIVLSKYASGFNAGTGAGLLMFAESLKVVVGVMQIIAGLDDSVIVKGGAVVLGLALMMSLVGAISANNSMLKFGAGAAVLAFGLLLLVPALTAFGALPFDVLKQGGIAIALLLAALTIASGFAKGAISGAASMLILAGALTLLAPAVILLGVAGDKAMNGVIAIAGAMGVLVIAGYAAIGAASGLAALTAAIAGLAGSFLTFAAGTVVLGAGIAVLTAAIDYMLDKLPGIGEKLAKVCDMIFKAVVGLIAYIFKAIVDGINNLGDWLTTKGAAVIAKGVVDLILSVFKIGLAVFVMLPSILIDYLRKGLNMIWDELVREIKAAWPAIQNALANVFDAMLLYVLNAFKNAPVIGDLINFLGMDIDGAIADVEARIAARKEKGEESGKSAAGGIGEGYEEGADESKEKITKKGEEVQKAVDEAQPTTPPSNGYAGIGAVLAGQATEVEEGANDVVSAIDKGKEWINSAINEMSKGGETAAPEMFAGVSLALSDGKKEVETGSKEAAKAVEDGAGTISNAINLSGKTVTERTQEFSNIIQRLRVGQQITKMIAKDFEKTNVEPVVKTSSTGWVSKMMNTTQKTVETETTKGRDKIVASGKKAFNMDDIIKQVVGGEGGNLDFDSLLKSYFGDGWKGSWESIGKDVPGGLNLGASDYSEVLNTMDEMGIEVPQEFRDMLQSNSPSKVFADIGKDINLGLANGVAQNQGPVKTAVTMLALASISTLQRYQGQFMAAGKTAGGAYALGILTKRSAARSAGSGLASSAKSGATGTSLYSTGVSIGEGLVKGIRSKISSARKAGYDLGKAGAEGANVGGQVKSPSRITIKTGKYIGEGLIVGMKKVTSSVVSAGNSLGATTANSLRNPLSIVSDILGADFDVDPTITPVLDLSNIQNGARSIGGILSGYSVNAGLINASMNGRVQVSNADVVSAINDLSNRVENLPKGDSYTVGAITYDDGTNIATAVRQLAAAARVQRRA